MFLMWYNEIMVSYENFDGRNDRENQFVDGWLKMVGSLKEEQKVVSDEEKRRF